MDYIRSKKKVKDYRRDEYNEIHRSIQTANSYEGDEIIALSNLDAFTSMSCNSGLNLQIKCYKAPLPPTLHEQCMTLFQTNMNSLYKECNWGLDLELKNSELAHPNARFLIAIKEATREEGNVSDDDDDHDHDKEKKLDNVIVVAFTHFRFECSVDECNDNNYIYDTVTASSISDLNKHTHEPIFYLYEIQIDPKIQRQNIGRKLMTLMQIIAMKMDTKKLMLTVFKSNTKAMDFYKKKLGYQIDESSPDYFGNQDNEDEEETDYEILSKFVQPRHR